MAHLSRDATRVQLALVTRSIEDIREDTEEVVNMPNTTGRPHDAQMKRLAVNSAEGIAVMHDEVIVLKNITEDLKGIVADYSRSSERFAKASAVISITALIVSILTLAASIYMGINTNRADKTWQAQELKATRRIDR